MPRWTVTQTHRIRHPYSLNGGDVVFAVGEREALEEIRKLIIRKPMRGRFKSQSPFLQDRL